YVFLAITAYVVFFVFSVAGSYIAVNYTQYYLIIFGAPAAMVIALVLAKNWIVTDIAGFLLTAGVASIWGLIIGAWTTVAFLAVFAVYDYIAVYRTKHMIGLARVAVQENLPMLFVFPSRRGVSMQDIRIERRENEDIQSEMLVLGFGDLMFPSVMVVSSSLFLKGPLIISAGLPALGSIVGILILLFGIKGRPAPGLPAINTGAIIGFLAAYAILSL
ncbi:MAG: presenilin family intramembrane aspartyl protease PSH, partial [Thermoplasmataceae archaeon]